MSSESVDRPPLSAILSTPHAQRESKLAAARNRLRINVEIALEDEDDNPLEAYCQLIYWTLENYPQGHSAESGLLELLEEATRILKDHRDGYWRTDLRLPQTNPTIIYRYLLANDIGTTFALLYEEFAIDEIYLLGVNRQASPIERLQAKHREFQKRMMLAIPLDPPHPPEQPQSAAATDLAHLPKPNARLQVFVDPFGGPGEGSQSQAAEDAVATPWGELGTRKERIKENIPKVSK
ncbi:hypothetical protein H4582DRAFT_2119865, partial [Lactarius indigo]